MKVHVMTYSRTTRDDCFKYRVLGSPEAVGRSKVEPIRKGDLILSWLRGGDRKFDGWAWRATCNGGRMLVPEVPWAGRFPWQVRAERIAQGKELPEADARRVLKEPILDGYPPSPLSDSDARSLLFSMELPELLGELGDRAEPSSPPQAAEGTGFQVRFLSKSSIFSALKDLVTNTSRSLDLLLPFIQSSGSVAEILGAIEAAATRGVRVRLITRPTVSETVLIQRLRDSGARVFVDQTARLHAKMALSDQHALLLGSFNLIETSTRGEEVAVLIEGASIVTDEAGRYFEEILRSLED